MSSNAVILKMKRALELANTIMSYCQGDKWESERTQKDRNEFNKLFKDITGKEGEA